MRLRHCKEEFCKYYKDYNIVGKESDRAFEREFGAICLQQGNFNFL